MSDEVQNQQAPAGGVTTPPVDEANQQAPAEQPQPNVEVPPQPPADGEQVEPGLEQETAPENATAAEVPAEPKKVMYMNAEVLEKIGENSDSYHCKLSDGTTAWVPKSIFGE